MKEIFSKNNEFIKQLKSKKRKNLFLLFLDNPKTIREAISSGYSVLYILIDKEKQNLIEEFSCFNNLIVTNSSIIKEFTSVKTPQGIIAVLESEQKKLDSLSTNFLVLDGIQDAGNLGTLLRTALGTNFKSIILLNCVSISNDKVIRSSMGSIFKLDIYQISKQKFINFATEKKLKLFLCDINGENIFNFKPPKNIFGIVLGNEGNGISNEIKCLTKNKISIPTQNDLESLNVAVAGSLIMIELNNKLLNG